MTRKQRSDKGVPRKKRVVDTPPTPPPQPLPVSEEPPEVVAKEIVEEALPTSNSDFDEYVSERIEKAFDEGVLKGYIPIDKLDRLKKESPKTPPMVLKAVILRDTGLRDFKFYLEVLHHFPINRNNRRLIVQPDGSQQWLENQESIYHKYCWMIDQADRDHVKYTQFSIPRYLMKTTITAHRKEWEYLRKTIIARRAPITMILCHKQAYAIDNLTLIKEHLEDELVKTLYADVLSTQKNQAIQMRFALPSSQYSMIKRRESHFMTGGADMSYESVHCSTIWADDWCSWENCDTPEKAKKNLDAFNNLDFLNDGSGSFRIDITNTMHYDDDMNAMFIEQQWGMFICVGAEEVRNDGSKIYNFPEQKEYTPEGIVFERKKRSAHHVRGNILMVPSKRETRIAITTPLEDYYDPYENVKADPIRHIFITLDPASSKSRKKQGCLQALLLMVNTSQGKLFVVDGYLSRGISPVEIVDRTATFMQNKKATELIVEINAAQGWIADSIEGQLKKRGVSGFSMVRAFSSGDKLDNISAFIEPLIRDHKLYIAPHLSEIVDEIYGKSKYVDGIDAVSFARFSTRCDFTTPEASIALSPEEEYNQMREWERQNMAKSGINRVCDWVD